MNTPPPVPQYQCAYAYIMSLRPRCSSLGAPLALRQADGVSRPVVHQLVQVVGEGAFAPLAVGGGGSGQSSLGHQRRVVLTVPRAIQGAGAAGAAGACRASGDREVGGQSRAEVAFSLHFRKGIFIKRWTKWLGYAGTR